MGTPIKILHIEDNPADANLIRLELERHGYDPDITVVEDEDEVRAAIASDECDWDAILADYSVQGFDGLEALAILKECERDIPFIIVSAAITDEKAVSAMKGGAHDFVMKGNISRLIPALEREIQENRNRKEAAAALKKSEVQYRAIVESMPQIAWTTTPAGHCDYFNGRWYDYLGKSFQETAGEEWISQLHPEDQAEAWDIWKRSLKTGEPYEAEYRLRHHSGTYRWFLAQALPQREEKSGEIVRWFGTCTDIHELKIAREARQESELRLQTLANNIPNMAWMMKTDGWVFWYNQRWYDYTGTTFEQTQGWEWKQVHHPDYIERFVNWWNDTLESGEPSETVSPLKGADGTYRMFLTRIMPIRDAKGHIYRWVGTNTDITDQLAMEEALAKQHEMVQEYARRLEDSNRDLSQFASIVSHDLQAPLRKVMLFSDFLLCHETENLSEEGRRYIDRILASISRMQMLITDLLSLSRVDQKQTGFKLTDLDQVLKVSLDDLALAIKESGAVVTIDKLCVVSADEHQMTQLFSNLIENAIKYRRKDVAPAISVTCSRLDERYVQLNVSDNGIGIKQEHYGKIFDIFQRLHHESQYSGTGIGLAIVKRIVDRHQGKISVESKYGEGTTFRILLPLSNLYASV